LPEKPVKGLDDFLASPLLVGEDHTDVSPKIFLIENLGRLKKEGYTTLFLEHLFYENQGELDAYFKSPPGTPLPQATAACASEQDGRIRCAEGSEAMVAHYNFSALIMAAKELGIRIVGIDSYYEYAKHTRGPKEHEIGVRRQQSMNYMAYHIIQSEMHGKPKEKWMGLVGETHLKHQVTGVLGVGELLGARTIHVRDEMPDKEKHPSTRFHGEIRMPLVDASRTAEATERKVERVPGPSADICLYGYTHEPMPLFRAGVLVAPVVEPTAIVVPESKAVKAIPLSVPPKSTVVSGPPSTSMAHPVSRTRKSPDISLHQAEIKRMPREPDDRATLSPGKKGAPFAMPAPKEVSATISPFAEILEFGNTHLQCRRFDTDIKKHAGTGSITVDAYMKSMGLFLVQLERSTLSPGDKLNVKRDLYIHLQDVTTEFDSHPLCAAHASDGSNRALTALEAMLGQSHPAESKEHVVDMRETIREIVAKEIGTERVKYLDGLILAKAKEPHNDVTYMESLKIFLAQLSESGLSATVQREIRADLSTFFNTTLLAPTSTHVLASSTHPKERVNTCVQHILAQAEPALTVTVGHV
jgi:hypothetical protein